MKIAGLQKTSTVDFPGCLCAVIFCAGCNYRCFYCHNKHILGQPPLLSEAEVSAFLRRRAGFLDGIVYSGGEPTLQKDIAWWLNHAKKLGYQTKLDTNGSRPQVIASLLKAGLVDYVAMDYKAPLEIYPSICFAPSSGVEESISILQSAGAAYELRTTVVPLLGMPELIRMAQEVPKGARWALQLYRLQPGDQIFLNGVQPYTALQIRGMAEELKPYAENVFARC